MGSSNGHKKTSATCSFCGGDKDPLSSRGTCDDCNRAYCKGYAAGIRRAKKDAEVVFDEFRQAVLS